MTSKGQRVEGEPAEAGLNRRALFAAAAGGFVIGASGLLLPEWLEEAEAAEGAYGGRLGGRRGKDRRGLDKAKRRDHGNKKNRGKGKGNRAPKSGLFFRDCALTVQNHTPWKWIVDYYEYPVNAFGAEKDPQPIPFTPDDIAPGGKQRVESNEFHMGVILFTVSHDEPNTVDANVRNFRSDSPHGRLYAGPHLSLGDTNGTAIVTEQAFKEHEKHGGGLPGGTGTIAALTRAQDSGDFIEWVLELTAHRT